MEAAKQITAKLEEVFAPMDAKVLEGAQAWAKGRKAALREFKASEEYKLLKDVYKRYDRLFNIAGGKTWYGIFNERTDIQIEEFMVKNHEVTIAKRNANIAAKLAKAGVTEVESSEFTHTSDGFNGIFIVNTNAGKKRVTIETIYAGGYNIQCLHLRVLVKVK